MNWSKAKTVLDGKSFEFSKSWFGSDVMGKVLLK